MRVLLVSANREKLPSPVVPLGLLYVAGALRPAHEVALVDLCFEPDAERALASRIAELRPEVVGIGLRNLHDNAYGDEARLVDEYRALSRTIRALSAAPIVLGGSAFSLQPERLMAELGADHGVIGEGEHAMRGLVDALCRGETPGRVVRAEASREPRALVPLGGSRPPSELDRLPSPARDLVDPRYYAFDGTDNLQTKRGCAFECTYCDYPDLEGRRVRVRDPRAIAREVVDRAGTPGVDHLFFVDSVFNVPRSHALATCEAIAEVGSPLPWICYVSPVGVDDALVAAMARAGCVGAEIGTDSGTETMLARLSKPFGLREVRATRAAFERHAIADCHTFVLGAEGETADEVSATLRFVDELDPCVAVFIVFAEDREARRPHRAMHRDAILELLRREAPRRPGWVVPELGVRFGPKLTRFVEHTRLRGPSWVALARERRRARAV